MTVRNNFAKVIKLYSRFKVSILFVIISNIRNDAYIVIAIKCSINFNTSIYDYIMLHKNQIYNK